MARRGRGGAALATAAIGSFVAGTLATVALTFVAPPMVDVALRFGPADYFTLMVLSFTGLVGIDLQTGQARYTLGVPELLDGVGVVIVAVGLFAVG